MDSASEVRDLGSPSAMPGRVRYRRRSMAEALELSGSDEAPAAPESVLLVEDDVGDVILVRELLSGADPALEVVAVASLAEAERAVTAATACVLFDLGLPDAEGLEGLQAMIRAAPHAAVVVLTGLADPARGSQAVGLGAEDYLVKGSVDGHALARSVRFAIARRRGEDVSRRLAEAEFRRSEALRLERGLLPHPLISSDRLRWASRYQPGGGRALLGGDFFDAVELEDGTVRVVLGDVCGHGPDEAALGVALRVAWRALVLADLEPSAVVPALEQLLVTERSEDSTFVTLCDLVIDPGLHHLQIRLAGHPAPLRVLSGSVEEVPVQVPGPLLGVLDKGSWQPNRVELGDEWTLLLFTDGLVEGRTRDDDSRLDVTGLLRLATPLVGESKTLESFSDDLVARVVEENGGPLADDVAMFLLSTAARWRP